MKKRDGQRFRSPNPRSAAAKAQAKRTPQGLWQRIRGRGTVSSFVPLSYKPLSILSLPLLLQHFLKLLVHICNDRRSRRQRCPSNSVAAHRDFSKGAEAARREVFPTDTRLDSLHISQRENARYNPTVSSILRACPFCVKDVPSCRRWTYSIVCGVLR